jgi:hypothetical protein
VSALCKTCGKPPVASKAGSVTAYFFQHNYCQCHIAGEKSSSGSRIGLSAAHSGLSSSALNSQPAEVCGNCGKALPENKRAGSFTAFLFKELRCQCAVPARSKPHGSGFAGHTTTAARVQQRRQFTETVKKQVHHPGDMTSKTGQVVFAPGTVIGGTFTIDSIVGEGGMGIVYLAEHNALHRPFALKVLSATLVNEQTWQRFRGEAMTIGGLNHPIFVKVYDLGIHEHTVPYYSMDYLNGRSLEEILIDDGPLPLAEAIDVFLEVLDGLAYAHRNGIIHRDLKPGNIMLCTAGGARQVKILDFGISKLIGQNNLDAQSLTTAGEIFGSPFYMSPEQCNGAAVDARSDIYSIGCTLFEVLTGYVPFEGDGMIDTVMLHQEAVPPRICECMPDLDLPRAIDLILAKCLAKSPNDRYSSAKEMALDLQRLKEGKEVVAFAPALSHLALDTSYAVGSTTDGPERRLGHRGESSERQGRFGNTTAQPLTPMQNVAAAVRARPLIYGAATAILLAGAAGFYLYNFSGAPAPAVKPVLKASQNSPAQDSFGFKSNTETVFDESGKLRINTQGTGTQVTSTQVTNTQGASPQETSTEARPAATASSESQLSLKDLMNSDTFRDIDDFVSETMTVDKYVSRREKPHGSEKETAPYSSIEKDAQGSMRVFHFPGDIIMGALSQYDDSGNRFARALCRYPVTNQLVFAPTGTLGDYPQYFARFRPGDIAAVKLYSIDNSDDVLTGASQVEGLKELRVGNCKTFTNKAIAALSRFKDLEIINFANCNLTGKQLAQANCFGKIRRLNLNSLHDLSRLLVKLAESQTLIQLSLEDTKLSEGDIRSILQIKNLRELNVARVALTPRQIRLLKARKGLAVTGLKD